MVFWGVTLESGKRYSQTVEQSYHLTMAALEPKTDNKKSASKYVSVMVEHEKSEYLICTLEPERNLQVLLDHMFVEGENITFFLNGDGTVHLTGYIANFDQYDDEDFDEEADEEDDELDVESEDESNSETEKEKVNAKASAKRKNEALDSSPEINEKKAKVDAKPAQDAINKVKVENKSNITNETNAKPITNNKIPEKNQIKIKAEPNDDDDDDDSEEDDDEDGNDLDDSLGFIDKEAIEVDEDDDDDDDDSEDDEESDSEEGSKLQKQNESPKKGQNQQNQQKQQQLNKSPQNLQNKNQNQSPQKQNQFDSGKKGGFQGNQQKGGNFQKGGWNKNQQNQNQQKNQFGGNQNQKGGGGWKNKFGGQQQQRNQFGGQNRNSFGGGDGQQKSPNFKGGQQQQGGNFRTPNFNQNKSDGENKPELKERKLSSGVIVQELRDGNGPLAKKGKFVHINFVGRLNNNNEFDRSGKNPFSFRLGRGEVIKGLDLGLEGMKVGSKRKIIISPNMGYGNRAVGKIPANSKLEYEVELKAIS